MSDLLLGDDGRKRCWWCGTDPLYTAYHDEEWGRFAPDDRRQFEFLVLESAQAGLSWITILRKRQAYRDAYAGFDPAVVAGWGDAEVSKLLANPGIVRNRRKIEASIGNARRFLEISAEHGSFAAWLLGYYGGRPRANHWERKEDIPATTPEARAIAGDMKARGFTFFGPVIAYSHLQATGIVDDHLAGCWTRHTGNA